MFSTVNHFLLFLVAALWTVGAASSVNDRASIVRRHQHDSYLEQDESSLEQEARGREGPKDQIVKIDQNGQAISAPPEDGKGAGGPHKETDHQHDGDRSINDDEHEEFDKNGNVTWVKDDHDTYPAPHLMNPDEAFNESALEKEAPWFIDNETKPEPKNFYELTHMQRAPMPHFSLGNDTEGVCKAVLGIKCNDTREVNWNIAGVGYATHGHKKKYKDSCLLEVGGPFPDGRLEECMASVAQEPACSNNFHMDAETYDCKCVAKDLFPCDVEADNHTCLYQLNPHEFDDEMPSEDENDEFGSQFMEEWNNAEKA
mmetsp:Transcript_10847/g.17893  ORF Transcript_10847/g.17893 Transcript_10847/m.17893 type:complete len:314 (+) Transcript_10847:120-1061(+)